MSIGGALSWWQVVLGHIFTSSRLSGWLIVPGRIVFSGRLSQVADNWVGTLSWGIMSRGIMYLGILSQGIMSLDYPTWWAFCLQKQMPIIDDGKGNSA